MMCIFRRIRPRWNTTKKIIIMKKIILIALSLAISAVSLSAQDMAAATETYNNGATALNMGDNEGALQYFRDALTMAEACGEEGADIVNNCKTYIPAIALSIAKEQIKSGNYDNAVTKLQEAIQIANDYQSEDVAIEASDLIPQVYLQKGNDLLQAKDFAGAAESYRKSVEIDSTNGMACLRLGQALSSAGDINGAVDAYNMAMRHGQQQNAVKQLSNTFIKLAASALKTKNYDNAVQYALKSFEYNENATAMQVAGQASLQLGKNSDAIDYFEKYVALSPNARNVNDIYYSIAVLAQQAGDNAKACGYYQKLTSHPTYGATAKQQITALKCN